MSVAIECQHDTIEAQEFDAGLSPTYDPITVVKDVCADCDEVMG